ncbi:MAG: hypothetical protein LBP33_07955, partial [Candidatus Adiutrix sp.]|nr:hypothetical protein [Candidatus Adiutrix sp.]
AEYIKADGGVKSFNFEFTEWEHRVITANLPAKTLANWLLCNSSHVIDLAFHLGGRPETWQAFAARDCRWCPGYSNYVGAGISESGAGFSYQANWMAPGRWGVEWLTDHRRLILRPLEQLHIQKKFPWRWRKWSWTMTTISDLSRVCISRRKLFSMGKRLSV